MKKLFLIIGLVFLQTVFCSGQTAKRIIEISPNINQGNFLKAENGMLIPTELKGVELVCISVEGKSINVGESFESGDDWLKTLKIKLKNVSGKPISSIRISVLRPEAIFKESSLGFSLGFGSLNPMFDDLMNKSVLPGEEFELSQTEEEYARGKTFMIEKTGVSVINRILIGTTVVEFGDGNVWTSIKIPPAR